MLKLSYYRLPNFFSRKIINSNLFWYKEWTIIADGYSVRLNEGLNGAKAWKGHMLTLVEAISQRNKQDNLKALINLSFILFINI